jgi:CheY-like chemotaxis protein
MTEAMPLSAPVELEQVNARARAFEGLHVLVAEDHPVNELLMRQLLLKLGCTVTSAHNGLEAVAAWLRGDIGLIMMDVQMPELNGLDATAEIRAQEARQARERRDAGPHVPIVAVTANAMSGDREKCMSAGMDAYTSKPVSPQALILAMGQALEASSRWQAQAAPPDATQPLPHRSNHTPAPLAAASKPAATRETTQPPPLSLEKLRRRLEGDEQVLRQLAEGVRSEIAIRAQALGQALTRQDRHQAMHEAHALKGTLAGITAQRASALANGLELAARSGEWSLFGRALPVLTAELDKLDQVLRELPHDTP